MELRIRIPWEYVCIVEPCTARACAGEVYCFECLVEAISQPWMTQELDPTALHRQAQIIQRSSLRRDLRRRR